MEAVASYQQLRVERDEARALANKLGEALESLERDSHLFQTRPCGTCRDISVTIGHSYGCRTKELAKLAAYRASKQEAGGGKEQACDHGWDASLIESTSEGVVCRKCGAEGAVYR